MDTKADTELEYCGTCNHLTENKVTQRNTLCSTGTRIDRTFSCKICNAPKRIVREDATPLRQI